MTKEEAAAQKRKRDKASADLKSSAERGGLRTTGGEGWSSNGPMPSTRAPKPTAEDYAGPGGLGANFTIPDSAKGTGTSGEYVWEQGPNGVLQKRKK